MRTYKKERGTSLVYAVVQVPNGGILLSKKGRDGEGADDKLKAYVKYENVGSGAKL